MDEGRERLLGFGALARVPYGRVVGDAIFDILRAEARRDQEPPIDLVRKKLSAAESKGPSIGRGFITSASMVVGCIAASLREARASTYGFGSSRVISVPAGGAACLMK